MQVEVGRRGEGRLAGVGDGQRGEAAQRWKWLRKQWQVQWYSGKALRRWLLGSFGMHIQGKWEGAESPSLCP